MADGNHIRDGRFINCIQRTQDDIVLRILQGMVIAKDNIGLIGFCACAGYCIVRTDDIIVLAICQCGIEPFHIVQLSRICTIFSAAAGNRVADTGDLGHIGFFHTVTAAHDHDLAAAPRNGFLQCSCHIS